MYKDVVLLVFVEMIEKFLVFIVDDEYGLCELIVYMFLLEFDVVMVECLLEGIKWI